MQPIMDVKPEGKTYSSAKDAPRDYTKVVGSHSDVTTIVKAEINEGTNSPKSYVDVDTIVAASGSGEKSTAAGDGDSTEYSSSFDGTESDTEVLPGSNEAEVESTFYDHSTKPNGLDTFYGGLLRKKKLTAHWKKFIRPLTWRCKWAELKVREMKSQISKYSEELAAHDQAKYPELDQFKSNDFGVISESYSGKNYGANAMKRRKRKRAENATDVSPYMSSHNLFSYFENKSSGPDGSSMADEFNNSVITYQNDNDSDDFSICNDRLFFEVRGGDTSFEHVLLKVERAQSQVQKMKSQLENLSLLEQTSSLPSPTFSSGNGDIVSSKAIFAPKRRIQDYDYDDLVLLKSAVSDFVEANSIPDIIESTVGMLSATEVTAHQPHMGDSRETIVDNAFLRKEVTERGRHAFRTSAENLEAEKGEQGESTVPCTIPASGHEGAAKSIISDFHFQNKRKRGERKACPGSWSKQQPCEPDSR